MFNKMIVGYVGSEGSRAALERAVDLMQYKPNTALLVAYVNGDVIGGEIAFSGTNYFLFKNGPRRSSQGPRIPYYFSINTARTGLPSAPSIFKGSAIN